MKAIRKISTRLASGTKVEYNVVLTFKSNKTNKNYCIYTDDTLDQNKRLRFYVACYDITQTPPYLGEPNTKEEWEEITSVINNTIHQK